MPPRGSLTCRKRRFGLTAQWRGRRRNSNQQQPIFFAARASFFIVLSDDNAMKSSPRDLSISEVIKDDLD
jgi:hypothetical protein